MISLNYHFKVCDTFTKGYSSTLVEALGFFEFFEEVDDSPISKNWFDDLLGGLQKFSS